MRHVTFLLLHLSIHSTVVLTQEQEQNQEVFTDFYADRGVGSEPRLCAMSWMYVGANGSEIAVDEACVALRPPTLPHATLNTSDLHDQTNVSLWCSTTQRYSLSTPNQWGYCLPILGAPATSSPTIVAPVAVSNGTNTSLNLTTAPTTIPTNAPSTSVMTTNSSQGWNDTSTLPPSRSNTTISPSVSAENATLAPSASPRVNVSTSVPTVVDTAGPSTFPTTLQSVEPTNAPSASPSLEPTMAPSWAPSALPTPSPSTLYNARVRLFPYRGSALNALEGVADVKISKQLFLLNGQVTGLPPGCVDCRLALHEGFSCNQASGVDSPLGGFWLGKSGGFWNATYTSDAEGTAELDYVIEAVNDNLFAIFGRTLVLFDEDENRIGCGKIVAFDAITAEIFPALRDNITEACAVFFPQEDAVAAAVAPVTGEAFVEATDVLVVSLAVDVASTEEAPQRDQYNETIMTGTIGWASGSCLDTLPLSDDIISLSPWTADEEGLFELQLPLDRDGSELFYTRLLVLDTGGRVLSCASVQPLQDVRGQFVIEQTQRESPIPSEPDEVITKIYGSMDGAELEGIMVNFLLAEETCFSSSRRVVEQSDFPETKALKVEEVYRREGTQNTVARVVRDGNLDPQTYNNTYIGIIGSNNAILGCGLFNSELFEINMRVTAAPTDQPTPRPSFSPTNSPIPTLLPSVSPTTSAPTTVAPSTTAPTLNETIKPISPPGRPVEDTDAFLSSELFTLILVLSNVAIIAAFLCFVFPPQKYWPKFFIDGTNRRGMIDGDEKADSTDEEHSSNVELEPQ